MDWTQQMEQMTRQWMDAQKAFWNGWAENARRSNAGPTALMWRQLLAAWQTSVHQMLDAQVEGIRLWTEGVAGSEALIGRDLGQRDAGGVSTGEPGQRQCGRRGRRGDRDRLDGAGRRRAGRRTG